MKILLFGISNVGKSTIGKRLSEKLNYDFDDVDDEIKRRYGIIDKFQAKYASYRERHIEKGKILEELVNKYDDNVVIGVSPLAYVIAFRKVIAYDNVLSIELLDRPENILDRLVYADENDVVHKFDFENKDADMKSYYYKEIKKDITFWKNVYRKIENKFNIDGRNVEETAEELVKYIEKIDKKYEVNF